MSEKCMSIAYVNILVFISSCIFVSVFVCRSYVMSYCARIVVLLVRQLQHGFTKNAKVSPNLTVDQ